MYSMPKERLAKLCVFDGQNIQGALEGVGPDGKPLDGAKLLWAMSGRESSFGQNMKPRHEPAYDVGGAYWKVSQEVKYGCTLYGRDFACSYGPLQVLAVNAKYWSPEELVKEPAVAMRASCVFLVDYVVLRKRARSLAEICQCWNGGHVGAKTTPGYVEEVTKYYLAGLPA